MRAENVNAANNDNALEAVTNGNGSALFAQGSYDGRGTFNGAVQINGDLTVTGHQERVPHRRPARADRADAHAHAGRDGRADRHLQRQRAHGRRRPRRRCGCRPTPTAIAAGWRYQLTPIGRFGQAIVEREVSGGRFTVRTEHPRHEGVLDRDRPAARSAGAPARRSTRSPRSSGAERGKYLEPSLYGAPASRSSVARLKADGRQRGRATKSERPRLASER